MTAWTTLGTGQRVEIATPLRRLAARLLDWVIMTAVNLVLLAVVIAVVLEDPTGENRVTGLVAIVALVLLAVVGLLYEVTMTALRGQTLGKMAARIRVVRADDGRVPGWGKSLVRWIIPLVLVIVPVVGWILSLLVYLSLLWDKVRQGWHDKAAKTLVIRV